MFAFDPIKKLKSRFSSKASSTRERLLHSRTFDLKKVSDHSIRICQELQRNGFDAWVVGGCVRDLLLGHSPKDFDVVTIATPQEIRKVFHRRSRIIGRRFQVCHVYLMRQPPIEVATLRTSQKKKLRLGSSAVSRRPALDNCFGKSLEEDACRRDFTINAIYYSPKDDHCIDYMLGMQDLEGKVIRSIGQPEQRFVEDPLRMIRAVRFKSKLGFSISPQDEQGIARFSNRLTDIPAARMLNESIKLFCYGNAAKNYLMLRQYDLFQYLFPQTDSVLKEDGGMTEKHHQFLLLCLREADECFSEHKEVSLLFLFTGFLWVVLEHMQQKDQKKKTEELTVVASGIINLQNQSVRVNRRWKDTMVDIWLMQRRLLFCKNGHKSRRILIHKSYNMALHLMRVRQQVYEPNLKKSIDWWSEYSSQNKIQLEERA